MAAIASASEPEDTSTTDSREDETCLRKEEASPPTSPSKAAGAVSLPEGMTPDQAIVQYRQRLSKAREYVVGVKSQLKQAVARADSAQQARDHAQAELAHREHQMAELSSKMAAAVQQESELREALDRARRDLQAAEEEASHAQALKQELEEERQLSARLKKQGEAKYKEAVELLARCRSMKQ